MMITNYNFRPLEVHKATKNDLLTLMAPKETAIINEIDTMGSRPSLEWTYHESPALSVTKITNNFTLNSRLD